jgi:hypothetical protein
MSVGGDIVSEVIALLQSIFDQFSVAVREYGGELDNKDKDGFELNHHLYIIGDEIDQERPTSVVLVEYAGVVNKPQDTSLLTYLNTYRVHVWLVAGYVYSTEHMPGGVPLLQATGLEIYDTVLDNLVARKLLKDAERLKLERSSRFFFGTDDDAPFQENNVSAIVYKLEFSFQAQSVWDDPPQVDPAHWHTAAGPVVEEGGFQADLDIAVNPYLIDFNERVEQPFPMTRTGWRSEFPDLLFPTALFPCADSETAPVDAIRDVVDGVKLDFIVGDPVLHRRTAAGLYAPNWQGMTRFNPRRAMELQSTNTTFEAESTEIFNPASGDPVPDPPILSEVAFGFMVVRLLESPADDTVLMSKWEGEVAPAGPGWKLYVNSSGEICLDVWNGLSTPRQVSVPLDHVSARWFGIFFYVSPIPLPGYALPVVGVHTTLDWQGDVKTLAGLTTLNNSQSTFTIGGKNCQIAEAAYWQSNSRPDLVTLHQRWLELWRGLSQPADAYPLRGLVLERSNVIGTATGSSMSDGEVVAKFAPGREYAIQQDPYLETAGRRALPHDQQRRNLLPLSENFALWTGTTDGKITGPDGMLSGYQLNDGSAVQISGAPAPGPYVVSVWARSTDGGTIQLNLAGTPADFVLTRKWRRVSVSTTITDPPPPPYDLLFSSTGGSGTSIEIWGAQFESGAIPSTYVPTNGGSELATFTECYVDWAALPGPPADRGKVQVSLLPGEEMVALTAGSHSFVALEARDGGDNYLRVIGVYEDVDGEASLRWKLEASLPGGSPEISAPDTVPMAEDTPLEVAARWSPGRVELWVESELAGRVAVTGPAAFSSAPTRCHLMRDGDTPPEETTKWIGACREVRWWKS